VADPWEAFNRPVFAFNEVLDRWLLEPVATGYDFVVPDFVQGSIDRFFDNIRVPIDTVNALLQGKPRDAGIAVGRFVVNSTVGFAGFFDPAREELGLEPVREDFGQTLGVWGLGSGPFLVLPVLGPTTPRDAVGLGVDSALAVYPWFVPAAALYSSRGTALVNGRSLLLDQVADSRKSALDYYVFVRNAYLQYRTALVEDRKTTEKQRTEGSEDDDLYRILPGY
jgi:phospholipid-binding lipoprotein MlaA